LACERHHLDETYLKAVEFEAADEAQKDIRKVEEELHGQLARDLFENRLVPETGSSGFRVLIRKKWDLHLEGDGACVPVCRNDNDFVLVVDCGENVDADGYVPDVERVVERVNHCPGIGEEVLEATNRDNLTSLPVLLLLSGPTLLRRRKPRTLARRIMTVDRNRKPPKGT
jgi:hypothetical protein